MIIGSSWPALELVKSTEKIYKSHKNPHEKIYTVYTPTYSALVNLLKKIIITKIYFFLINNSTKLSQTYVTHRYYLLDFPIHVTARLTVGSVFVGGFR